MKTAELAVHPDCAGQLADHWTALVEGADAAEYVDEADSLEELQRADGVCTRCGAPDAHGYAREPVRGSASESRTVPLGAIDRGPARSPTFSALCVDTSTSSVRI